MIYIIAFILLHYGAPGPSSLTLTDAVGKGSTDTLKYDDGEAEGFYVIGDYSNDKFAVSFEPPFSYYRVHGVLLFAETSEGFAGAILCPDQGVPDTTKPFTQLDSVYSGEKEWVFTSIDTELKGSGPIWFVMRAKVRPGLGGDTDSPTGNSWCYSESSGWQQSNCNWLIRLIIEDLPGYYEDFANSSAGYTGEWEFGVPSLIPPPEDNCFGTRLDATYPDNTYLQLESPWIPVGDCGLSNPMLVFKHLYVTECVCDGGNLKISKDGNSWQLVSPVRGYDKILSDAVGLNGEPGFSGNSNGWKEEFFIFPVWDSLKIRWCFGSDIVGNDLGWFIDEVNIRQRPSRDVLPVSTSPKRLLPPEAMIAPSAVIRNLGMYSEGIFETKCVIESCGIHIYEDVAPVSVEPGSIVTVDFSSWKAGDQGTLYDLKVCSNMPGDENPRNDTIITQLLVFPLIDSIGAGFTECPPQVDGMIDSAEWKDATVVDGSDILGMDSADSCETCMLYFMNSNSTLYIGCKADSIEEFRIYLDESGNGQWDREGNEGYYSITQDRYSFQDMYYHFVYPLADGLGAISAGGVEISIPIGVHEPYQIPPTELMKCFAQAKQPSGYTGWWPQDIISGHHNNPAYYAKIGITGIGVEEPGICHGGPLLHIRPNPVNSRALIDMRLPDMGQFTHGATGTINHPGPTLSLELHDLAGRLVRSTRIIQQPGLTTTHVSWDTNHIASGVYFLVYKINSDRITKKITILH
jgi:hypothetical protein